MPIQTPVNKNSVHTRSVWQSEHYDGIQIKPETALYPFYFITKCTAQNNLIYYSFKFTAKQIVLHSKTVNEIHKNIVQFCKYKFYSVTCISYLYQFWNPLVSHLVLLGIFPKFPFFFFSNIPLNVTVKCLFKTFLFLSS